LVCRDEPVDLDFLVSGVLSAQDSSIGSLVGGGASWTVAQEMVALGDARAWAMVEATRALGDGGDDGGDDI